MSLRQAVNAPRVHHQHLPDRIEWEPGSLQATTVLALEALGHTMRERPLQGPLYPYIGDMQAVMVMSDGTLEGASDPRRGGVALGY
jgi:gamma-glutamyltranspeptidase/glutathione hydrolase